MTTYPLPEPYDDGTPQDHADALRDHADPRIDGRPLDFIALSAADVIEQLDARVRELEAERDLRQDYERERREREL